ncbi:MAG TPA: DUF881 domain-containing protein [Firmicutes bacterium]|nr:DUF881 domain-containing protein [Bacillota bacterium]
MNRLARQIIVDNKFIVLLILVLTVNTALIGLVYSYLSKHMLLSEEEFSHKQKLARDLWEYNRRLADDLEVADRSAVKDALARLIQEVELASTGHELAQAILSYGRRAQETILRESEMRQREQILALVNQDPQVAGLKSLQKINIAISMENGIEIDPAGALSQETIDRIAEAVFLHEVVQSMSIDIEVENGRGVLLHPFNPVEHIKALTAELDSLRVTLREVRSLAGYTEMIGPGIIVKIYDSEGGYTSDYIIHETDVRDVVNELFASGSKGVAVGEQRLTATSAIRCVGPLIMVNDERIAVNPVVIKAVGDPELLESGIEIIKFSLENMRNIRIEVERKESLTLPAYSRQRED